MLTADVTEQEIKAATFNLGKLKAPGLDGFSGTFYQANWDTVKEDIIQMTKNFIATATMPQNLNKTRIVLIPKLQNP